jgi:hypothetical protein
LSIANLLLRAFKELILKYILVFWRNALTTQKI